MYVNKMYVAGLCQSPSEIVKSLVLVIFNIAIISEKCLNNNKY